MSADKSSNSSTLIAITAGVAASLASVGLSYFLLHRSVIKRELEDRDFKIAQLSRNVAQLTSDKDKLSRLLALAESSSVDLKEKPLNQYHVSVAEVEKLRALFNLVDHDNDGSVKVSELPDLFARLGEPLAEDEAAAVTAELDRTGSGIITFEKFLLWWYESHKGGKGDNYTARFKLMSAKLSDDFLLERLVRQETGVIGTLEYRIRFYYKQLNGNLKNISPWHDIPLYHMGSSSHDASLVNFVCEIPKWTRAKFEIATGEPFNPIKQDVKNGALRYLKYGDYFFNYGALPQTWEDPHHISPETGFPGDNDPIDVLEIGTRQLKVGEVVPVKVLGVLALIDDKETDWKIVAINIHDPLAASLNDIDDVDAHLPGALDAIRTYFAQYKSYQGCVNTFALNNQAMPKQFALDVIEHVHKQWMHLEQTKQRVLGMK